MFREIRFQKPEKLIVNNGHKPKYVIVFLKKHRRKDLAWQCANSEWRQGLSFSNVLSLLTEG